MRAHQKYDYWKIKTLSICNADPVMEASIFDPPPAGPCDSYPPHDRNISTKRGTQTK